MAKAACVVVKRGSCDQDSELIVYVCKQMIQHLYIYISITNPRLYLLLLPGDLEFYS